MVGISANCSGEGAEPEFLVEIAPSQNAIQPGIATWKVGTPVFVIVTRKNISQHALRFALTNPAFDYETTVLDAQGKPVPETENFRKMKEAVQQGGFSTARHIMVLLEPQETHKDSIEVSYLYKLDKPGTYTVQVELPGEAGSKSNILRITLE